MAKKTRPTKKIKHLLLESDRKHLIHPQHHPVEYDNPQIWVSGKGIYLTNYEKEKYIDGLSGMWNVYVGHGRKELRDAASNQIKKLAFASAYAGATNLPAIELIGIIKQHIYPNIEAFYFTLGGSDATDTSVRTARFYWGALGKPIKQKIVSLKLSYHGSTIGAASITGVDEFSDVFGPRLNNNILIDSHNSYRFTTEQTHVSPGIAAANLLEEAILGEGAENIAAFIAEPIQGGGGGIIVPPDDYFKRIREICDLYDILFISDEVITGFGRTGKWFALEHWGVEPDIVQFAKGITSGYFPLGGIGVSKKIKEVMDTVSPNKRWWHGYTCSAHPVGCAIAVANLNIIRNENLVENAALVGKHLFKRLKEIESHKYVGQVRGMGLLAGIEIVANRATKELFPSELGIGKKIRDELLKRGLYTRVLDNTICLAPPLITTTEQIDAIANIVIETINNLTIN